MAAMGALWPALVSLKSAFRLVSCGRRTPPRIRLLAPHFRRSASDHSRLKSGEDVLEASLLTVTAFAFSADQVVAQTHTYSEVLKLLAQADAAAGDFRLDRATISRPG